ncbi:hypothetical protein [Catalinimonas niigatensis]|uniref:hypothetical protein n=1 Tax=Catalinimonas niigatensis TaxID=1397264 RepID=UPI002666F21A|nr:hypothetical protein [Catalinimonas niigatensis]WPP52417.1 hypothetical protein PZB72_08480 [Catalinimonas niigatensis]
MNKKELELAINFATSNQQDLMKSDKAGCYYCRKIYPASEVKEFLEEEATALCPKCGIDSVLPDYVYDLSINNLRELHQFWF